MLKTFKTKVSTIWVKNLNSIVTKMSNTKPLMVDLKPKDTIKLNIVKPEAFKGRSVTETGLYRYLCQSSKQHALREKGPNTELFLVRIFQHLD